MNYISLTFTFFFLFKLLPCSSQTSSTNFRKKSKVKLEKQFDFELDHKINFTWNGKDMVCWDNLNNEIKKFDFRKKTFYQKHKTSIKNYLNYNIMLSVGKDSLLTYSYKSNYSVKIINYEGRVLNNYSLEPAKSLNISNCEKKRHPSCFLNGTASNTFYNNYFYYAGYNMGENKTSKKLFSGGRLNLKTGDFEYFTEFPPIYNKYNWGAMYYYFPHVAMNNKGQLVVSYPASHDLYVYDLNAGKHKSVNAGSSMFSVIKPFSRKKELKKELKGEYSKYYYTNYSYAKIMYDKKEQLYYRMALFPKNDYGKTSDRTRKISIIVLNKDFVFLGEDVLPMDKDYYNMLTTDYGIVAYYYDYKNKKNGFTLFKVKML